MNVMSHPTWGWLVKGLFSPWVWSPDAALTTLYTAVSSDIVNNDIRGKYFHPIARMNTPGALSPDVELQKRTWELSEELIAKYKTNTVML
eukprot:UN10908